MSSKVQTLSALFVFLLLLISGCDPSMQTSEGGMGGSGSGPGGGTVAEGGMGGSGSGTSSGYGSIYINDQRHYQIAADALIYLDGALLAPSSINPDDKGLPLGLVTEFLLGESVNEELTQGTVIVMEANHQIIGPVTQLSPLEVLHQPVRITLDTKLEGVDPAALTLGQVLKVAGLKDLQGRVRASRLATTTPADQWQLIGRIGDLNGNHFKLGQQSIELLHEPQKDCSVPLTNGMKVLLRTAAQASFSANDSLTEVNYIRCLGEGLSGSIERLRQVLPVASNELPSTLPATTDGFISRLIPPLNGNLLEVELDGQRVDLSNVLPLLLGTVANLSLGTRIEVDGVLDTTTGVLKANRLILRDELSLFRIIAPITTLEDGTLTLLGQPIIGLPQSDTSLFAGLTEGDAIELVGFVSEGARYAFSVKKLDSPPAHISIRGVINDVQADTTQILIGGVPFLIDTASSISLLDQDGILTPITDLLGTVICGLLPFLCPPQAEPVQFNGMLGELKDTSLSAGSLSAGSLNGGELKLMKPALTTP